MLIAVGATCLAQAIDGFGSLRRSSPDFEWLAAERYQMLRALRVVVGRMG
jgi:hypothetical protein